MRFSLVIVLIFVLLVWYSLFGGVTFFSEVDIFSAVSINLFVLSRNSRLYLTWVVVGGLIIDLIMARYLGILFITNAFAMLVCSLIDNFFKLFGEERKIYLVGLYMFFSTLIITFLDSISVGGGDLDVVEVLYRLVFNLLIAFVLLGIFSKFENRSTIKV